MFLVNVSLLIGTPVDDAELRARVIETAAPQDGLEHVFVQLAADEAQLVFFIRAGNVQDAERAAAGLCRRTLAASPLLLGWALVNCAAAPALFGPSSPRP